MSRLELSLLSRTMAASAASAFGMIFDLSLLTFFWGSLCPSSLESGSTIVVVVKRHIKGWKAYQTYLGAKGRLTIEYLLNSLPYRLDLGGKRGEINQNKRLQLNSIGFVNWYYRVGEVTSENWNPSQQAGNKFAWVLWGIEIFNWYTYLSEQVCKQKAPIPEPVRFRRECGQLALMLIQWWVEYFFSFDYMEPVSSDGPPPFHAVSGTVLTVFNQPAYPEVFWTLGFYGVGSSNVIWLHLAAVRILQTILYD